MENREDYTLVPFFTQGSDSKGTYLECHYPGNNTDAYYEQSGSFPARKLYIYFSHNRFVYDHSNQTISIKHLTENDAAFPSCVCIMPDGYKLVIEENANTKGLTILSNKTKVFNPYGVDIDIIGRIYNIKNEEITIKGKVISRQIPLVYNYTCRYSASMQYDNLGINRYMKVARDIGITECLLLIKVLFDESNSVSYFGGNWDGYSFTARDFAPEIVMNGLSARALKFHSNGYGGEIAQYIEAIYDFTLSLYDAIDQIEQEIKSVTYSNGNDILYSFAQYSIQRFSEIYIANERPDWTKAKWVTDKLLGRNSNFINDLNLKVRISFAGMSDLHAASSELYPTVSPALNFYPHMTFLDDSLDVGDANEMKHLVEVIKEHLCYYGKIWGGRFKMSDIPISETGVQPYQLALRAPSLYNSAQNPLGDPFPDAVLAYWKAMKEALEGMLLPYVDFFYTNELKSINNEPTDFQKALHDLLVEFPKL